MVNKQICFINLDKVLARPASGKSIPEDWADFRLNLDVLKKLYEDWHGRYLFLYNILDFNFTLSDYGIRMGTITDMVYQWYQETYDWTPYIDYLFQPCDDKNWLLDDMSAMFETFLNNFNLTNYSKDSMFILGNSLNDRKFAEYFGIDYVTLNSFLNGIQN